MTDRAKKISQLLTTSSVANTDKIVVLKDAANTTAASTRAMTVNAFAQSLTALVQANIPNTTVIANSVTVASDGANLVSIFSYSITEGRTGCCHFTFDARDVSNTGNAITSGTMSFVVLGSTTNVNYTAVSSLGTNKIYLDNSPLVNTSSNTVTLYLRRDSEATTNVNVRYSATIF